MKKYVANCLHIGLKNIYGNATVIVQNGVLLGIPPLHKHLTEEGPGYARVGF